MALSDLIGLAKEYIAGSMVKENASVWQVKDYALVCLDFRQKENDVYVCRTSPQEKRTGGK